MIAKSFGITAHNLNSNKQLDQEFSIVDFVA